MAAIAESVALGARCRDDLEVPRADLAQSVLRGFDVPALQTLGLGYAVSPLGHIRQLGQGWLGCSAPRTDRPVCGR